MQALIMLVTEGNTDKIREVVLNHKPDFNRQGYTFNDSYAISQKVQITPLHAAVSGNHASTVALLLELGADPNPLNLGATRRTAPRSSRSSRPASSQSSPLSVAAANNALEVFTLLLDHGANPNIGAPLCDAVRHGDDTIAKMLLNANADVNQRRESNQQSALYIACANNKKDIAFELIKRGADLEAAELSYGYTPLMIACINNRTDCINLLSVCGANVKTACKIKGSTPLYHAAQRGCLASVKKLVSRGAEINRATVHRTTTSYQHNQTPLMMAVQRAKIDVVKYLIEENADLTQRQGDNQTLLYMCITAGSVSVFTTLLEHESVRDTVNTPCFFVTPLYTAAQHNRSSFVPVLLEHGADINIGMYAQPNAKKEAKTPIQIAAEYGCTDVVQELVAQGADLGITAIAQELRYLPAEYSPSTESTLLSYTHENARVAYCATAGDPDGQKHEDAAFNSFEFWKLGHTVEVDLDSVGSCASPSSPNQLTDCDTDTDTDTDVDVSNTNTLKVAPDIDLETVVHMRDTMRAHAGVTGNVSRNKKQCNQCGQRFSSRNLLFRHLRSSDHEMLKHSTNILRQIVQQEYKLQPNWDHDITTSQLNLALAACVLQYIIAAHSPKDDDESGRSHDELLRISLVIGNLVNKGADASLDCLATDHSCWYTAGAPPTQPSVTAATPASDVPPASTAAKYIKMAVSGDCLDAADVPHVALLELAQKTNTPGLTKVFGGFCRRTHVGLVLRSLLYNTGGARKYLDIARFTKLLDAVKSQSETVAGDVLAVLRATDYVKYMVSHQLSPNGGLVRNQSVQFLFDYLPEDLEHCKMCAMPHDQEAPVYTVATATKFQRACRHVACKTCTTKWIQACTKSNNLAVLCPEPGCTCRMFQSDVSRIAGSEAKERLKANQDKDFRGKYLATFKTAICNEVESALFGSDYIAGCAQLQLHQTDATRKVALKILQDFHEEKVQVCEICDECYDDFAPTTPCIQVRHDRFTKQMCDHSFCGDCIASWVNTVLSEHSAFIRCPHPNCSVTLYADDVLRIAGDKAQATFVKLKTADYRGRLLQSLKEGLHFEEEKASRPCPACRVVIYRFAGCDDFLCSCGHKFNFVKAKWPTVDALESEIAAISAADETNAPESA